MAGVTCAGCDQDAVVGVMAYGPEGGTTDLCPQHLAEWALAYASEAYPELRAAMAQGAEAAVTGEGEPERPETHKRRRRGAQAHQEPQAEPSTEADQDAALSGAEHDQ